MSDLGGVFGKPGHRCAGSLLNASGKTGCINGRSSNFESIRTDGLGQVEAICVACPTTRSRRPQTSKRSLIAQDLILGASPQTIEIDLLGEALVLYVKRFRLLTLALEGHQCQPECLLKCFVIVVVKNTLCAVERLKGIRCHEFRLCLKGHGCRSFGIAGLII